MTTRETADLAAQFCEIVVTPYDEYMALRNGNMTGRGKHKRAALQAANALFHFREHLPPTMARTRAEVSAACPDYRLVADVANAAKHRKLDKSTTDGKPLVTSVDDIHEITVVVRYEDEEGHYSDVQTVVEANCIDGSKRPLDVALTQVINYWAAELRQAGVFSLPARVSPPKPGSTYVSRSEARTIALEAVNDLDFRLTFQVLVFKPSVSLSVRLAHKVTGEEVSFAFPLSDEESRTFVALRSQAEIDTFRDRIVEEHREEIEVGLEEAAGSRPQPGRSELGDG